MQKQELLDWAGHFFRNMDLIQRKIVDVETKEDKLEIEYKDKKLHVYADDKLANLQPKDEHQAFIVPNKEENLKTLISRWDELASNPNLKVYFVNPGSASEKRWIISPYMHSRIAERESLEQGLRSLFDTVDPV